MSKTFLLAATAAASIALAACSSEPEVIGNGRFDPQAEALKNAAPVAPPPMVSASKTYRCSDNSLFYVDFYSDNTATIRTEQTGTPTSLTSTNGAAALHRGGLFGQRHRRQCPHHRAGPQQRRLPHLIADPRSIAKGRSGPSGPALFHPARRGRPPPLRDRA